MSQSLPVVIRHTVFIAQNLAKMRKNIQNPPKENIIFGSLKYIPYICTIETKNCIIMTKTESYNLPWEIAKAIIFFAIGIPLAWVAVWVINVLEWCVSISIGSFFKTLFLTSPHYSVFHFVCDAISMFPYVALIISGGLLLYTRPWYISKISFALYVLLLIPLFDPNIIYYLPESMRDIFHTLQHDYNYRFVGGVNFWDSKFSEKISDIQYGIYDAYMIILTILIIINRDKVVLKFND